MTNQKQFYRMQQLAISLGCFVIHVIFINFIFNHSVVVDKVKPIAVSGSQHGSRPIQIHWQHQSSRTFVQQPQAVFDAKTIHVKSSQKTHSFVKQDIRATTIKPNPKTVSHMAKSKPTSQVAHQVENTQMAVDDNKAIVEEKREATRAPSVHQATQAEVQLTAEKTVQAVATVPSEIQAMSRRVNYPNRARALGVEGHVKVQFDITESGAVKNIQILEEAPKGIFVNGLIQDMSRWRYRVTHAVENQVVHIVFRLDGRVVVENQ